MLIHKNMEPVRVSPVYLSQPVIWWEDISLNGENTILHLLRAVLGGQL